MKHGAVEDGQGQCRDPKILVTGAMKVAHPVVGAIARNLAEIDRISIVRISPDFLQASSETTGGRTRKPITTPGHPTAIGVSLILDLDLQEVQFYEITSAVRGYGGDRGWSMPFWGPCRGDGTASS